MPGSDLQEVRHGDLMVCSGLKLSENLRNCEGGKLWAGLLITRAGGVGSVWML